MKQRATGEILRISSFSVFVCAEARLIEEVATKEFILCYYFVTALARVFKISQTPLSPSLSFPNALGSTERVSRVSKALACLAGPPEGCR